MQVKGKELGGQSHSGGSGQYKGWRSWVELLLESCQKQLSHFLYFPIILKGYWHGFLQRSHERKCGVMCSKWSWDCVTQHGILVGFMSLNILWVRNSQKGKLDLKERKQCSMCVQDSVFSSCTVETCTKTARLEKNATNVMHYGKLGGILHHCKWIYHCLPSYLVKKHIQQYMTFYANV